MPKQGGTPQKYQDFAKNNTEILPLVGINGMPEASGLYPDLDTSYLFLWHILFYDIFMAYFILWHISWNVMISLE